MNTKCIKLLKRFYYSGILIVILFAAQCAPAGATLFDPAFYKATFEPAQLSPDSERLVDLDWPEYYINPAMEQGLSLVIPDHFRKGLLLDAGYDRWEGLPTVSVDYFVPLQAWSDKSVFFSPRMSLSSDRESYSLGAGVRHLITSDALIGLHAFHDWVRPRGSREGFLREAGVGLEFSALPGNFTDFSLSVNAYIPVNEKKRASQQGRVIVKEVMPYGIDTQVGLLLPPLIDWLDIRLDAQARSYRGDETDIWGYQTGLTLSSRDGMFTASFQRALDSVGGENYQIQGGISLAFDWTELLEGRIPLAAPYEASPLRFSRKLRDGLSERVVRTHDLPTDRSERLITLAAAVNDETVSFHGAFPLLANSPVTVQVSQSPWRDIMHVMTDSQGAYSGRLKLPPGEYLLRLVHKPSGLVTGSTRIVIQ